MEKKAGGTLRKIFHFDSPRERYRCDAAVIWCFDNRIDPGFRKFLKRIGVFNPDSIRVAGGAKALTAPDERDFIIEQIRRSIRLHATERVILMVHSDCGAYGGLEAFGGDVRVEAVRLVRDLESAAEFVRKVLPSLRVEGYVVDFEGVWDAELVRDPVLANALSDNDRP